MITGKRLKELAKQIPDDAEIYAYGGESTGIGIRLVDGKFWWINASEQGQDTYTEGFDDLREID